MWRAGLARSGLEEGVINRDIVEPRVNCAKFAFVLARADRRGERLEGFARCRKESFQIVEKC